MNTSLTLAGTPALVLSEEMTSLLEQAGLPPSTLWDVVLVDGPMGWDVHFPGRMQSIATAAQYSSANSTVFVHDCHRELEQLYAPFFDIFPIFVVLLCIPCIL